MTFEQNNHGPSSEIEKIFSEIPYSDTDGFAGEGLLALRLRHRTATDPETGQTWHISDTLSVHDTSSVGHPAETVTRRMVHLIRGEGREQISFNFNPDTSILTVAGPGEDSFTGDPDEEFLAGLNIIEEYAEE